MNAVQKRTALYVVGLVLLALYLIGVARSRQTAFKSKEKIAGVPSVHYAVPPLTFETLPTLGDRVPFDWMNGEQCGCDGAPRDLILVDSIRIGAYDLPTYIPAYVPVIPPALKAVPVLEVIPSMPPPQVYTPPIPTFWFDFRSPYTKHNVKSRFGNNMIVGYAEIRTSDGNFISAGGDGWQMLVGNQQVDPYSIMPPDGGYRDPTFLTFNITIGGRIFTRDASKDIFR